MRTLALLLVVVEGALLSACAPGRCEGAFRMLLPRAEGGGEVLDTTADVSFWINADSHARRTPDQLLADSGVSEQAVVLTGPSGPVPVELSASLVSSAHSCASAATLSIKPRSPLAPGTYVLAVLLDKTRWPAVWSGDVVTWRGQRALVRRYRVK